MQTYEIMYLTVTLGSVALGGLVALLFIAAEKFQKNRHSVAHAPLLGVVFPKHTNKGE